MELQPENTMSAQSQVQTQNLYDNSDFFAAYSTLPRSQEGLAGAREWPTMRKLVLGPNRDLQDHRVLDLGCGYGWFSRWARDAGATHVRGIDVSANMVQRAKEFDLSPESHHQDGESRQPDRLDGRGRGMIQYEVADLETIVLHENAAEKYDLVYSSLAFHYLSDLKRLLDQIRAVIRPSGRLVFSVEHPVLSAPVDPEPEFYRLPGDTRNMDAPDGAFWALNSYSREGPRYTSWLGVDGVRKYHRTLETYIRLLLESGFVLTGLREWTLTKEETQGDPVNTLQYHRPYFLLISAEPVGHPN